MFHYDPFTGQGFDRTYNKGGGGSQQSTNTVQNSDPWKGLQPYLTDYLKMGQQTTRQPFQFYSGDQIAPFSPEQQLGMDLTTKRALAGSPLLNAGQTNATDTLNGKYMSPDSNPWLKANVDQAMGDVSSRINSQFGNNNFGGSAHQELLTRNLGNIASNMYGENYGRERQAQLGLIPQTPGLSAADYFDPAQLMGVGGQRQGQAQQYLDLAQGTFQGAADWPYNQLARYGQVVGGGSGQGGTQSSTTTGPNPNQQNGLANALGLASTGYGLFGSGGLLGGLGGLGAAAGTSIPINFASMALPAVFSDERLKSNIVKIGDHPKGFGIYEYDIFGHREIGVMAQEVEKIIPEAVSIHPSGFKQVNYSMLGV